MKSATIVMLVVAIGVTGGMFAASGFNDAIGVSRDTSTIGDAVDSTGQDVVASDDTEEAGLQGDPRVADDGAIIGFIVGSTQTILNIVGMVVYLPHTLMNLGFPAWFASPLGNAIRIIGSIGVLQFAIGRIYR